MIQFIFLRPQLAGNVVVSSNSDAYYDQNSITGMTRTRTSYYFSTDVVLA